MQIRDATPAVYAPRSRLTNSWEPKMTEGRNVFGEPLAECCNKPVTGFYRDGSCNTGPEDFGLHTVCTRVDRPASRERRMRSSEIAMSRAP